MNKNVLVVMAGLLMLIGAASYMLFGNQGHQQAQKPAIISGNSYALKSDAKGKDFSVKTGNEYSFFIQDNQGVVLKDFAITHTKPMHVIIVSKDLTYFQHIHPDFNPQTGQFTFQSVVFPADGQYRIIADFAPAGSSLDDMGMPISVQVFEDVVAGDTAKYTPKELSFDARTKNFEGIDVSVYAHGTPKAGVENMLMFSLYDNGQPVTNLEPYLGALGHAVILREGTLDFIHAHPMEALDAKQSGMVDFMVIFPKPGKYRAFTQFQRNGKLITTDFVIVVD